MTTIETDRDGNSFELRPMECPVCGDAGQKVMGYRGGGYQRNGAGIASRIVRCRRCRLLFPNPFPYPVDAQRLYGDPAKYFEGHDEEAKVAGLRALLRELGRHAGVERPSVLDVGSGRGELIHAARLEDVEDVVGLEFSAAMIEYVREKYGVELVAQTIEEYAAAVDRTFDVVVLNAVIEHVYDPDVMVEAARRLTRPGSVVHIDTPQDPNLLTVVGNLGRRLRGNRGVYNLAPTFPPYHVFGFSRFALRTLLEKHGFEVQEVRVHATPQVPPGRGPAGRAAAFVATQINRIANLTGTASNMCVRARRR